MSRTLEAPPVGIPEGNLLSRPITARTPGRRCPHPALPLPLNGPRPAGDPASTASECQLCPRMVAEVRRRVVAELGPHDLGYPLGDCLVALPCDLCRVNVCRVSPIAEGVTKVVNGAGSPLRARPWNTAVGRPRQCAAATTRPFPRDDPLSHYCGARGATLCGKSLFPALRIPTAPAGDNESMSCGSGNRAHL